MTELEEAKKAHNVWAMLVDSEFEKAFSGKLTQILDERERISKDILEVMAKHFNSLLEITEQEAQLQEKMYNISGEWGLNNFEDKRKDQGSNKFYELLYYLTEGQIFGYNLTAEKINQLKKDFQDLGLFNLQQEKVS